VESEVEECVNELCVLCVNSAFSAVKSSSPKRRFFSGLKCGPGAGSEARINRKVRGEHAKAAKGSCWKKV
jgi:hypothetical protein